MDRLDNLLKYIPDRYHEGIKGFLEQVSPEMEERKYEIYGVHIFARVMSYDTKERKDCRIEAHDRYIDVQATITGAEGIDVFDRRELRTEQEYQSHDDVAFFAQEDRRPYASNQNIPGMFSMLFPGEAHRPQVRAEGYESHVKKFVIKMEVTEDEL